MILEQFSVSGYRGYSTKIVLDVDSRMTAVVGANDAGKSSLFDALQIFFGNEKVEETDFPASADGVRLIEITCTFSGADTEIILDSTVGTSLGREHLLDPAGRLTLVKRWSGAKVAPKTLIRCLHPVGIDDSSSILQKKLHELKRMCKEFSIDVSEIDSRVASQLRSAIWAHCLKSGIFVKKLVDVEIAAGDDGKRIIEKISSRLPHFHLFRSDRQGSESDGIAQDPAKEVAYEVLAEYSGILDELTERIQEKLGGLLKEVIVKLGDISPGLAASLEPRNLKPEWRKAVSAVQFQDEDGVPLSRRGSGTRRMVLLSFFRAMAERETGEAGERSSIIAIEEPETSLHPDMQKVVWRALSDVASVPERQVLLTTHSTNLVRMVPPQSVRYIKNVSGARTVISVAGSQDPTELLQSLAASMGTITDHAVLCFLLIEGPRDLEALSALCARLSEGFPGIYPDLDSLARSGAVSILPVGGCGAAELWSNRLTPFDRPEVHVFDSDRTEEGGRLKDSVLAVVRRNSNSPRPNRSLHILERRELENYLTREAFVSAHDECAVEAQRFVDSIVDDWRYLDLPLASARLMYEASSGRDWEDLSEQKQKQKEGQAKIRLAKAFGHSSMLSLHGMDGGCDLLDILSEVHSLTSSPSGAVFDLSETQLNSPSIEELEGTVGTV